MSSRILYHGVLTNSLTLQLTAVLRECRQHTRQLLPEFRAKGTVLCVIPFARHEAAQIYDLLTWIGELGGCKSNPCLLMADCRFDPEQLPGIIDLAQQNFASVDFLQTPYALADEKWPKGPNWMFENVVSHVSHDLKLPFFWNEPDCIPLCPGWLAKLEREYKGCGRPFMGAIIEPKKGDGFPRHLTGCAIYPPNAIEFLRPYFGLRGDWDAWDCCSAPAVVPHTHHSTLLHMDWGAFGKPPTFRHPGDLNRLSPVAAVFHRSKDGWLTRLLRARRTASLRK